MDIDIKGIGVIARMGVLPHLTLHKAHSVLCQRLLEIYEDIVQILPVLKILFAKDFEFKVRWE